MVTMLNAPAEAQKRLFDPAEMLRSLVDYYKAIDLKARFDEGGNSLVYDTVYNDLVQLSGGGDMVFGGIGDELIRAWDGFCWPDIRQYSCWRCVRFNQWQRCDGELRHGDRFADD